MFSILRRLGITIPWFSEIQENDTTCLPSQPQTIGPTNRRSHIPRVPTIIEQAKPAIIKSVSSSSTKFCHKGIANLKQSLGNTSPANTKLYQNNPLLDSNIQPEVKICSLAQRIHQSRCCKGLAKIPPSPADYNKNLKKSRACLSLVESLSGLQCTVRKDTSILGQPVKANSRDKWGKNVNKMPSEVSENDAGLRNANSSAGTKEITCNQKHSDTLQSTTSPNPSSRENCGPQTENKLTTLMKLCSMQLLQFPKLYFNYPTFGHQPQICKACENKATQTSKDNVHKTYDAPRDLPNDKVTKNHPTPSQTTKFNSEISVRSNDSTLSSNNKKDTIQVTHRNKNEALPRKHINQSCTTSDFKNDRHIVRIFNATQRDKENGGLFHEQRHENTGPNSKLNQVHETKEQNEADPTQPKRIRRKWNTRALFDWWKNESTEYKAMEQLDEDEPIYEFQEKLLMFGGRPLHGAYLRPAGSSGNRPLPRPQPSNTNISKSASFETKDTHLNITDSHQSRGNGGDDRSAGFRVPFSSGVTKTTDSIMSGLTYRSVDSEATTVTMSNAVKTSDAQRMGAAKLQMGSSKIHLPVARQSMKMSDPSRINPIKVAKDTVFKTDDKSSYKEKILDSLKRVREENQKMEMRRSKKPQRSGWQLIKTRPLAAEPFKVTKCRYVEEEDEPLQTEVVGGCRVITTSAKMYNSTLKNIHPSNKIYESIPNMETSKKEELLADFANAGIDLETLGEHFEEIGIKVSHDPITHQFKEIPVFRRPNDNIRSLMTTQYL